MRKKHTTKAKTVFNLPLSYFLAYTVLAVFLSYQLVLTLYQVGKGISYQAKLAKLNQEYLTLSKEKTDLAVTNATKLNLAQALSKAKTDGFTKLQAVALTSSDFKVALLP